MEWNGWTAGIIDGEGCITIVPRKRSDAKCRFSGYCVKIMVANTDKAMIDKLVALWGGSSYFRYYDNRRTNRACAWSWCVTATNAVNVLTKVFPYLITKKERAVIAMEMQKRISDGLGFSGPYGNRASGLTEAEIAARERLFLAMKKLNVKPGLRSAL